MPVDVGVLICGDQVNLVVYAGIRDNRGIDVMQLICSEKKTQKMCLSTGSA